MVPITPQIKERFVWYKVNFEPGMWMDYMREKYAMPKTISSRLCGLIETESFEGDNFSTGRSFDKATNMIINNVPTPYEDRIKHILNTNIKFDFEGISRGKHGEPLESETETIINLEGESELVSNELIPWLEFIQKSKKLLKNEIITK